MKNHSALVAGLVGALVGTVLGAGSVHYASLIAGGYAPSAEGVAPRAVLDYRINSRNAEDHMAAPRGFDPRTDTVPVQKGEARMAPSSMHRSAPVEHKTARQRYAECEGLSRVRGANCRAGVDVKLRQTPENY